MKATPTLYTEPSIVDKTTAPEGFAWSIINNNPTVNPTEGATDDEPTTEEQGTITGSGGGMAVEEGEDFNF